MGLRIASFTISTLDIPGTWSLLVFLKGCNFRCKHCHNWKIVLDTSETDVSEEDILFEVKNNPILEAIVISGGEPSIYSAEEITRLVERIREVKEDIKIRIDTNGYKPEFLENLRDKIDGFAVDIKAPLENRELYSYVAGREIDTARVKESLRIADGMELTLFRTPRYPWLEEEDLKSISRLTDSLSSPWQVNEFVHVHECPFNRTPV